MPLGILFFIDALFLWNTLPYDVTLSTSLTSSVPNLFTTQFLTSFCFVTQCWSVFMQGTTIIGLPFVLPCSSCTQRQIQFNSIQQEHYRKPKLCLTVYNWQIQSVHVLSPINLAILQLFIQGFSVMSEHLTWITLLRLTAYVVIKYT